MYALWQDIRYGLRMLSRNPGFTAVALLTLTLGIGANTAIFSVIDSVVLRPLPFASPDRLVWINGKLPQSDNAAVCPPDFVDYRAANRSFDGFAAFGYKAAPSNLSADNTRQVFTTIATANFFRTLGISPMLGREFQPSDEQVDMPQVAVLGYGIWRREFGEDPGVIGRQVRLDGQSLTIVGVLPTDLPLLSEAEIWVPAPLLNRGMNVRLAHFMKVIGRLRPAVSLAQSQADLDAIAARLASQYPETNKGWSLRQRSLSAVLIGPVRPALLMIWGAVGLLLLITCSNVANLLLARSAARQREFAVRVALGGSRGDIVRQTLTESVMLAFSGGALGVLGAIWGVRVLRAIGPSDLPRLNDIHVSVVVLAFTAGISVLTGLVFGLIPALRISRHGFAESLKEASRFSLPAARKQLSGALVIGEVALSLTLLVGAGLLLRSFWQLIHVNPGFDASHVFTARLAFNGPIYRDGDRRITILHQLEERLADLTGVEAVGATSILPLSGEHTDNQFRLEGRTYGPSEFDNANFRSVTPDYLSAMHIPLRTGRWLDEHDTTASAGVMLVNEAFSKRFFAGQNALGKRLQIMGDRKSLREIVGIVGSISHSALRDPQEPEMYVPYSQYSPTTMTIVVRAMANASSMAAALNDILRAIDKDDALSAVRSMDEVVEASVAQPRFSSQLVTLFAVLAVLLAAVGLYGLTAYAVAQRTNEIGIRMAFGARPNNVLGLVLQDGLRLTIVGAAFGLAGSFFAARLVSKVLFGVTPTDPLTFLGAAVLLVVVALIACYIPARRATRVDPLVALRYE